MNKHIVIWFISLILSLSFGWLDYETTSWYTLFCNPGNMMALLLYIYFFAGVIYLLKWLFKKRNHI